MPGIVMTLIVSGMLCFFGAMVKYGKAYDLIAGYNTASDQEKKYMAEKGLGDFIGRQLMITAGAPILGIILSRAGCIWGIEIGLALLFILVIYTVIGAQRYNPPPSTDPESRKKSRAQSKMIIASTILAALIVAGVGISIAWTAQNPQFTLNENQFLISGAYGVQISYTDIDSIELRPTLPGIGIKNNGLNLGPILKGHFDVKGLGPSLLFLRSNQGPVIIIYRTEHRQPVLINFADAQQTSTFYQQLQAKK